MSVNEKSIYSWILYIEISYNMYIGKKILENLLCCQENVLCVIDALMNIMKHYHQKKNPLAS